MAAAVLAPASQQEGVAAESAEAQASQQEVAVAAEPAAQLEPGAAVPVSRRETAGPVMAPASQQVAKALASELKAPPEEAAERCCLVTTLPTVRVLIQAQVTILLRRKGKDSG